MKPLRRLQVVAGVVVVSAAAGATAGLLVVGVILATKFGHARPDLVWEFVKLGAQSGAAFGVLLGPPTILGVLRRVPLYRLLTATFASATYGGVLGFALSMAIPQPRPLVPLVLMGSITGFGLAALRLWARFREARTTTSVPEAAPVGAMVHHVLAQSPKQSNKR
jgi:hypothetical protein